jgi:hypothetical protein
MRIGLLSAMVVGSAGAYAAPPIDISMATQTPGCDAWNQVVLKTQVKTNFTPAVYPRMIELWRWIDAAAKGGNASAYFRLSAQPAGAAPRQFEVVDTKILGGGAEDWTPDPRRPNPNWRPPDTLRVCLTLRERLPSGSLDASLQFLVPAALPAGIPQRPPDLADPAVNHSLPGPSLPNKPPNPSAPGSAAKGFERELDFAGILLSSVADKTTNTKTTRARTTKATGDLFLAPILRLRWLSYAPGDNLITFFTPLAIEAHASNQPIAKDTLSQNRIVIGPEYEFRFYLNNRNHVASDNLLRVTVMGKDASDRDFKLNEAKFATEVRPVWGRANRDVLDPKSIAKVPGYRLTAGDKIGRRLSPFVGFETGKSYLRGRPADVLVPVGPFRRGYFGMDAGVDFNGKLSLATTQTLYLRNERNNDLVHYMKNTLQWTFLASRPNFASAIFFTFEKGQLPPFRSAVNSVNLGIRVQSSKWGLSNWR